MSENGSWACMGCNAVMPEAAGPSWRWTGEIWQHRCKGMHPQAGHFDAKLLVAGQLPDRGLPDDWMKQVVEALDGLPQAVVPPAVVTLPWSWAAGLKKVQMVREVEIVSLSQGDSVRLNGVDIMFGNTEKPVFSVMADELWKRFATKT